MYDYDYDYDGAAGRPERGAGAGSMLNPPPSMGGRGRQPLDARRRATQRTGARGECVYGICLVFGALPNQVNEMHWSIH